MNFLLCPSSLVFQYSFFSLNYKSNLFGVVVLCIFLTLSIYSLLHSYFFSFSSCIPTMFLMLGLSSLIRSLRDTCSTGLKNFISLYPDRIRQWIVRFRSAFHSHQFIKFQKAVSSKLSFRDSSYCLTLSHTYFFNYGNSSPTNEWIF